MKKLCSLLLVLLLLTGCGNQNSQTQAADVPTVQTEQTGTTEDIKNPLVSLDIYAVNDLHGRLSDTDFQPGVDELSTYLQEQPGNKILLSTGDMWQGASESYFTNGLIVTEWMNEMEFAAMTMGGHEFDWGEEWIRQNDGLANFPFLGINVYDRRTDQRVDYCQSSVVIQIEGARIGIIGAIGDCYSSISSEHTADVYFKTGQELTELVKAESQKLRSEGADFIIYSIHDGFDQTTSDTTAMAVNDAELESYYDTALSDGYVDLVFEADSHYWYVLVDQHGVYHLQGGANNNGLSHVRVLIDKTNNISTVLIAELVPASKYNYKEDHPVVAELLEKYEKEIAPGAEALGNNSQYRNKAGVCQLVANLYCTAGLEKWGDRYDIVLAGGYISCRSPGFMPAGPVTYGQVLSLLPFDNRITLCSIQGCDLLEKFLETDHYAYYIKTTPYGESIRSSIDPDATYYVVTDTYSAYYAPNNMTVIDIYDENTFARDLLAEYISSGNLG